MAARTQRLRARGAAVAEVFGEGFFVGAAGVHRDVVNRKAAALGGDNLQELAYLVEVARADGARVDRHAVLEVFKVAEFQEAVEREGQLFLGHDVEEQDFVVAVAEVVERLHKPSRIVEEVAYDDHHATARDAFGNVVEDAGEIGVFAGFPLFKVAEDDAELAWPRPRGNVALDL